MEDKKLMRISLILLIGLSGLNGNSLTVEDANKMLIQQNYQLINEGHWREVIERGWEPGARNHGWQVGPKMIEVLRDIVTTFPDYKQEILEIAAEGEVVTVRAEVSGTWLGKGKFFYSFGGQEPNGKKFKVQQIHWYKLRDQKVLDHWAGRDDVLMMSQLGLYDYSNLTAQEPHKIR